MLTANLKAHRILDLILSLENVIGTHSAANRPLHLAKIESFVRAGRPVHMILPAFPAKSPNPRKTVGHRPDYGEVLALRGLNELCARIFNIYESGAGITICSDGRVFSDVVSVGDGDVDEYGNEIKNIIAQNRFTNLDMFSLEDIFSGQDYDSMRVRLSDEFAESLDTVRMRVKTEEEMRSTFNGIHRFMFEDQSVFHPMLSRNAVREKAKVLAYEVIRRSNAWSRLVEQRFSDAVRLSIHPQLPGSSKIGIRLLPSNDAWRTPWHSVAVFDGSEFILLPRSQAEAAGAVLSFAENKYPFYKLTALQAVAL